jgi:hypothetical protein
VHDLPPVDVIRTVVAVTAPVVLAAPKALTQSPTATAEDVVDWVSVRTVDFAVVTLSFCVLGLVGFLDDFEAAARLKTWLNRVPDNDTEVPLTAVTLPVAMAKLANDPRAPPPVPRPGKLPPAGVPEDPDPPVPDPKLPRAPPAPPNPAPPAPVRPPRPLVHVPLVDAWEIVMERAARVVLDFLAGVPVTVKQSPTATALMVSVAVSENVVDPVQVTAVCAVVLCTSIVLPLMLATLPLAALPRPVVGGAAPATPDNPRSREIEAPTAPAAIPIVRRLRLLRRLRLVSGPVAIAFVVSFIRGVIYSLLSASIGARWAARLAG